VFRNSSGSWAGQCNQFSRTPLELSLQFTGYFGRLIPFLNARIFHKPLLQLFQTALQVCSVRERFRYFHFPIPEYLCSVQSHNLARTSDLFHPAGGQA
jgi:hypothetical protein